MAEHQSKKDIGVVHAPPAIPPAPSDSGLKKEKNKKKKGLFTRVWNAVFRSQREDFEKRLKHISKEEAAVLLRMRKRSLSWKRLIKHFILLSLFLEIIAVGFAIMTTRTLDLDWRMRALRVFPMFLLPCLSFLAYSAFRSFARMLDRKDQKIIERLRTEKQKKIDELKEKTNYYITQQLIQRYDSDPAAKAAAATVLASKLGAESGLKFYVGDESNKMTSLMGKSSDLDLAPGSGGLRNRKIVRWRGNRTDDDSVLDHHHVEEMLEGLDSSQLVVEHQQQIGSRTQDGGWLARLAALIVGEDPRHSYALICGNCHMHNGLARKEEFPFVTYYCPHCSALNRPERVDDHASGASGSPSSRLSSSTTMSEGELLKNAAGFTLEKETASAPGSPVGTVETEARKAETNVAASDGLSG